MRRLFAALLAVLLLTTAACRSGEQSSPVLAAPGNCVKAAQKLDLGCTLMTTSTASASLRAVQSGEVEYALVPLLDAENAIAGTGNYPSAMSDLTIVGYALCQSVQLVSCIGAMDRWSEETVVVAGERGSAQADMCMLLFQAQGANTNNVQIVYASEADAVKTFTDGRADAILLPLLPGADSVAQCLTRKNAALMNLPERTVFYFQQEDPSYGAYTMADAYKGRVLPVDIVGLYGALVARTGDDAIPDLTVKLSDSILFVSERTTLS